MSRILVLGGAGLIGASLLKNLIKKGYKDITVLDDLSRGKINNIPLECNFIKDNICNIEKYNLGSFDVIFHLVSFMLGLGFSEKNQLKLYDNNVKLNENFISFLLKQNPDRLRLIYISSSCVYSDDGEDIVDESSPLGNFPELANIGYGFSKRYLEDRLKLLSVVNKFELSIVRPLNIYGESYRWAGEFSQAIPMLINKVMTSNDVEVWGSGNQKRSYVHADDCAELLVRIAFNDQLIPLLNIGHEKVISMNDLVMLVAEIANKKITIINNLKKPEGRRVKGCSLKYIKIYFHDFNFNVSLKEGLYRMIYKWYINNKGNLI